MPRYIVPCGDFRLLALRVWQQSSAFGGTPVRRRDASTSRRIIANFEHISYICSAG